ncbi:MAG: 2-amino-4-hydroxy-6-hydroxymethyldihydropteridine diphosphokinase [Mariprofundales bacterium]|nr:2-amino-4-hydroxy-6-hydroxymethyldihydropteridine diphosphokinase [Mariprofundales bacterium]
MGVVALIALGGNLGAVAESMAAARGAMAALPQLSLSACSSLYRTAAVTPDAQPDYLNAVVVVEVGRALPAAQLLQEMHGIERQFGRIRAERWGARTLDLDLLSYGDLCCDETALQLPHPRMVERHFVLAPLVEVAPEWVHPRLSVTARQLYADLLARGGELPLCRVAAADGW